MRSNICFHFPSLFSAVSLVVFLSVSVVRGESRDSISSTAWQDCVIYIGGTSTDPTYGTTHTLTSKCRQIGDSMEINFAYTQTGNSGASAGSGTYLFTLNPNFVSWHINTSVFSVSSNFTLASFVGTGATHKGPCQVYAYSNYQFAMQCLGGSPGSSGASMADSNAAFRFTATVPAFNSTR